MHLIFAITLVLVGLGLIQGALWASITAVILVMLNMIRQLMLLSAYARWSLAIIAVDFLIVWALLVHGDEPL